MSRADGPRVGAGLGVHGDVARAGLGVAGRPALRVLDHEVAVERHRADRLHRLHDRQPEGQVRDEVGVHDVEVQPVGVGDPLAPPRPAGRSPPTAGSARSAVPGTRLPSLGAAIIRRPNPCPRLACAAGTWRTASTAGAASTSCLHRCGAQGGSGRRPGAGDGPGARGRDRSPRSRYAVRCGRRTARSAGAAEQGHEHGVGAVPVRPQLPVVAAGHVRAPPGTAAPPGAPRRRPGAAAASTTRTVSAACGEQVT